MHKYMHTYMNAYLPTESTNLIPEQFPYTQTHTHVPSVHRYKHTYIYMYIHTYIQKAGVHDWGLFYLNNFDFAVRGKLMYVLKYIYIYIYIVHLCMYI